MARSRNIKPSFFTNDVLAECSFPARLLFAGLWVLADREGRLEDRPKKIKGELFPHDDIDADQLLSELAKKRSSDDPFILRYQIDGSKYIQILNFKKHQNPHQKEQGSLIPAPDMPDASTGHAPDKPGLNPLTDSLIPHPDAAVATRAPHVAVGEEISRIAGWDKDPRWFGDYSRVEVWLKEGWDPERDIYPTVRRLMAAYRGNGPPKTLAYFEGAIADAHAARKSPLPQGKINGTAGQKLTNAERLDRALDAGAEALIASLEPGENRPLALAGPAKF